MGIPDIKEASLNNALCNNEYKYNVFPPVTYTNNWCPKRHSKESHLDLS
jgi:hypothetical protein